MDDLISKKEVECMMQDYFISLIEKHITKMDVVDFCTSDRLSYHMCAYIDCREIVKRGGVE